MTITVRTFDGKPIAFQRARADKSTTDDQGRMRVTLSTEEAASDGHVIDQNGWDLTRYRGAFLWEHNRSGWMGGASSAPLPPIGRVEDLEVLEGNSGPELQGWIRFFESVDPVSKERVYPLAYQLAQQYREGFLTDVSVGFVMLETQPRSELPVEHAWFAPYGLVSRKTLLLELSGVIFGADHNATVDLSAEDAPEDGGRSLESELLTARSVSIERSEEGEILLRIKPGTAIPVRTEEEDHKEPIPLPDEDGDPDPRALNEEEEGEDGDPAEEALSWFPGEDAVEARSWFPGSAVD